MTARTLYLARRGDVFQLRIPIPRDLHQRFGRKELRWSLATCDSKVARQRTCRATLDFERACAQIRKMPTLQSEDISEITRRLYASLIAGHEPPGPIGGDVDYYELRQTGIADELERDYRRQLEERHYDPEVRRAAQQAMGLAGGDFDDLPSKAKKELLEGVTRAKIEYVRYSTFRQQTALEAYDPADAMFRSPPHLTLAAAISPAVVAKKYGQGGSGGSLGELVEKYLSTGITVGTTGNGPWKTKTRDEKATSLAWFTGMVGPARDVRNITADDLRAFRDAVTILKRGSSTGKPLKENATSIAKDRIDCSTAKKRFGFAKEFLRWLATEGFIHDVLGDQIDVPVPTKAKSLMRRPFVKEEVNQLFASSMFTGCKTRRLRHEVGTKVFRDSDFWMPLVLFYTGMRLSEPLQIAAEDVVVDDPHPHFRLLAGKIHLKNDGSERDVPIHPDLIEMGFLDFVRERQATSAKQRLFREISSSADLPNYYSQRLGRYIRRIGIDDPRVVTHSFRHYAKDVFRNAKIPEEDRNRITGHSSGSVASSYGHGANIKTLWDYMATCDFGLTPSVKVNLIGKGPAGF